MCGIYGEFFNNIPLSDKAAFLKSNAKNSNRGPDMEGYWSNEKNCQLGFRRLAILDISEQGNQPMFSFNKKFILVFNGEIYNYLSWKEDLINEGYKFHSATDTEVLVNCLQFLEYSHLYILLDLLVDYKIYILGAKR